MTNVCVRSMLVGMARSRGGRPWFQFDDDRIDTSTGTTHFRMLQGNIREAYAVYYIGGTTNTSLQINIGEYNYLCCNPNYCIRACNRFYWIIAIMVV